MTQLSYAGIGSRETPAEILKQMTVLSAWMSRRGWHLHSGGAAGADTAFARAHRSPHARSSCPGPAMSVTQVRTVISPRAKSTAAAPRSPPSCTPRGINADREPGSCTAGTSPFYSGASLSTPVSAVVCWTKGGQVIGGTGMGIRIAQAFDIPVLNFGSMHPREICLRLEEIRTAA